MRNLSLIVARLCLAGWVGAAALFVVTSVREQVAPDFDAATRAALALVRFPAYYLFGFALTGTALVAAYVGLVPERFGRNRRWICCGLAALAIVVMAIDHVWVYRPLAAMMAMAPSARPVGFGHYHELSKYFNFAQVGLCFAAACTAAWPPRDGRPD